MWRIPAAAILVLGVACMAPAMAAPTHWEPGRMAAPEVHAYTVCDTARQVCYDVDMEFLLPVLHGHKTYWVVRADVTILAGFPPGMVFPAGFVAEPYKITGEPADDMPLLAASIPPGIPTMTYAMLYDGTVHPVFTDHSRMIADSLRDTLFGINAMMDGVGTVRIGERWGELVVTDSVNGMYLLEYAGQGGAAFLVDPDRPIPLAGAVRADRYDPHIGASMWFYADEDYMDMLYDGHQTVDVSGPDRAIRAGTLSRASWASETYQVESITTTPDRATIRGKTSGDGTIKITMPAFGSKYTFWQEGMMLPADYKVVDGVLSAMIRHASGNIEIHSVPAHACTGHCLEDLTVRAWDGPTAIVYGSGFHGMVGLSMASGDPAGTASALCPAGSTVTVDFDDSLPPRRTVEPLPYVTTYESGLNVTMSREGSAVRAVVSGEPGAVTFRMPAMVGRVSYAAGGLPVTPLAESTHHDTVTATIRHAGGTATYDITADGPSSWKSGLALPSPVDHAGAVWCGQAEPVNAAVIRENGAARQDCGATKFTGGWNVWC